MIFNNKVTFQRMEEQSDGMGGQIIVWNDIPELTDVPCRIQPKAGRERFVAGKDMVFSTHRLFMRVPAVEITEKDRVKFGDRIFEIVAIMNWDESKRYYRLDLLEKE